MMTDTDRDLVLALTEPDAGRYGALVARLATQAGDSDLLDVAYRTVDSPLGSLLLASTPRGLVRLGYAREEHHAVLARLAGWVSPRGPRGPGPVGPGRGAGGYGGRGPGLIRPRASSMSPSPAAGASSACRWTSSSPAVSGWPSCRTCARSLTARPRAMPWWPGPRAAQRRSAR